MARVELQGALQCLAGVIGRRSRVAMPAGGKVEPRPTHPHQRGHLIGRLAQRRVEALQGGLERGSGERLSQEVLAPFHEVARAPGGGIGRRVAMPPRGHVAAHRQVNLQRGVAAFGAVVAAEPLAQPPGFDANDGVAHRIERLRRARENLDRQHLLLQCAHIARDGLLHQVAQQMPMAGGGLERAARGDARELGSDQRGRDAVLDIRRRCSIHRFFVVGHRHRRQRRRVGEV